VSEPRLKRAKTQDDAIKGRKVECQYETKQSVTQSASHREIDISGQRRKPESDSGCRECFATSEWDGNQIGNGQD
jgi:hypothetical protein